MFNTTLLSVHNLRALGLDSPHVPAELNFLLHNCIVRKEVGVMQRLENIFQTWKLISKD